MHALETTKKFFDELACRWDDEYDQTKVERIRSILRIYIPSVRFPILDMGSGTGIMVSLLKELSLNGSRDSIIEMDIAGSMLKKAREKMYDLDHVFYMQSDAHQLPVSNGKIHTVLCFQVFPHFYDKRQVISEIHRVLPKGGNLIILHLMGHRELNQMHAESGRAVKKDRIIPAVKLAGMLSAMKFDIKICKERSDLFLIIARKRH